MADRRDYVALEWVKGEIEETLKQAQFALEAFVEAPDDINRLQFSLAYLHQVYGTLHMVEFFGAALLAEEMELLNQAFVDGKAPANQANLAVLMQAIIQLPTYLDRIKQGQFDLPIVILPLLNDLRAARGEALLSETSLFSPDLSAARRFIGEPDYTAFVQTKTAQLLNKLRQMYQLAMLGWLKGQDEPASLDFMAKSVARVVKLTERTKVSSYWSVVDAFVTAIKTGLIERSPATVKVLRDVDQSYRALLKEPVETVQSFASDQQLKNLLFYLAKLGETGVDRIDNVQRQFKLLEALPSERDVAEQREKLAGPDRGAINNVVSALLEELARLKDALDLMVRTQIQEPKRLNDLVAPLQQLCDTMSIVGLNNPRRVLGEQLDNVKKVSDQTVPFSDSLLMDIAGALLYCEATLVGIVGGTNKDLSSADSSAEIDSANDAVLREARTGIERVKEAIVEFIGAHFDSSLLTGTSSILSGVYGGLLMVPLNDASRVLQSVQKYIDERLIADNYRPQWHEMDLLADALVGVEYYLERLTRDGSDINLDILKRAASSLEQLGLTVVLSGSGVTQKDHTEEFSSERSASDLTDEISITDENAVEDEAEEDTPLFEVLVDSSQENIDEEANDFSLADPDSPLTVEDGETLIDWDSGVDSQAEESDDLSFLETDISIPEDDISAVEFEPQAFAGLETTELADSESDDEEAKPEADLSEKPVELEAEPSNSEPDDEDDLIDDEILEIFIEEAAEVLEAINEFYPKYKQNENDTASLAEFRRAYHTMKGSGRMVGALVVGETAWSVENMLNRLIDGTISRSGDLLRVVEEVTAELPTLVKAFEEKGKPDSTRADALAEIAHALSRGESVDWSVIDQPSDTTDVVNIYSVGDESSVAEPELDEQDDLDDLLGDNELEHSEAETVVDFDLSDEDGEQEEDLFGEVSLEGDDDIALTPSEDFSSDIGLDDKDSTTETSAEWTDGFELDNEAVTDNEESTEDLFDSPLPGSDEVQNVEGGVVDDTENNDLGDIRTEDDATDSDAVSYLEEDDDDSNENLLKIFQTELESHLEFIDSYINDSPIGSKVPDALQRALHTIKGSAHMASMDIIAEPVTPVETIVKDLQERGQVADEAFVSLLTEMVMLVKANSDAEPGSPTPDVIFDFVQRALNYHLVEQVPSQFDSQEDVSLMTIFLSESMDIVMDAEDMLEQWRDSGSAGDVSTALIRELDTLAQAAQAVDLTPLSQLSNELKSLYVAAEANPYLIESKFFELAYDGHESLISMMDRLAAGQSIRKDALFSERLQQFFDLHAVPYNIALPEDAPAEEVDEQEPEYLSEAASPQSEAESPPVVPSLSRPISVTPSERFHIEGDAELVEIFLEEANDILESIQRSLESWALDTQNTREVEGLQRDLHTLKGGARMAEIKPLGDLAHELEFLYEGLAQSQYKASDGLIALLQQCHDRLAVMVGDIESSMSCESAPDLVSAIASFRANPGEPPKPVELRPVVEEELPPVAEVDDPNDETSTSEEEGAVEADSGDEGSEGAAKAVSSSIVQEYNLPEDVDFDILEIFIDEASELLNELENAVEDWRTDPENDVHSDEMKRVLHTLKGGARLARLRDLGDLSHDFETFVIKAQQDKLPLDDNFFTEILSRQDQLVSRIEQLQNLLKDHGGEGGFGPSVIQLASEMEADELDRMDDLNVSSSDQSEEADATAEKIESNVVPFKSKALEADDKRSEPDNARGGARRVQPQETVKVNANLLEGLVNLAGETSIARARLEQEVSDFSFTLSDMDQTIDRLRDHVRRLDMETEAQILFRQERAEETNYEDFDPLEMDRYSQIQQLSRSLMEAAYDLQDLKSTLTDKTRDAETILLQQSRINTELQEGLMRTRMVPFSRLLPRLRRIVRQVASELGKQIDFVIGNAEGEVDRTVLERMISPLEHLLRNAVDHGIEKPEERQQNGKALTGVIRLDLSREGSDIVLRLDDDGKGLDIDRIRSRAIERGLMQASSDLNETEIMQFILEAGFSTAERVTQISGRGVGMDVVNSEVKQLGGSIFIDSERNRGTLFTIRLPFTVSVNRALMVNLQDDLYALPLTSIEGIVRVTPKQLNEYYQPNAPLFEYGGSRYRLEYMGAFLHSGVVPNITGLDQSVPLVLVRGSDDRHSMALHVDRLMGSREIVVKSLGMQFSKVPGVSGATILGDGSVVVILDLSALIRSELAIEGQATPVLLEQEAVPEKRKKDGPARVMVCDDSVTVRKVTSRLLERNGMEVMLAKHGADAIAQMIDEIPDLILLDIEMPYMDGFEVASRVRHDERLKHIPIIMITSRTGSKHRERALSIGVNEYLGKPFQEGPLLEMIEQLLAES
jgi:chemosensory pili system protein ChpA (sensor histidine kinase/response regulator)